MNENTPAATAGLHVVSVDDDPAQRLLIRERLHEEADAAGVLGLVVQTYDNPADALAALPTHGEVVILCDRNLGPGTSDLVWIRDLVAAGVGPVVMLTAGGSDRHVIESFHHGASDYLLKTDVFSQRGALLSSIRDARRRFWLCQRSRDVTQELTMANAELERKNEVLAKITETAHRFVDNVAHEFRTPLAVVREFASIIGDGLGGPVTERQCEYLDFIRAATEDLASLVDDFLDSSKLRAGTLRVNRRSCGVDEIIDHVAPIVEARAAMKKITIERHIDPDVPAVTADIEKAGRVIINLVVNAIKVSAPNSVIKLWARPCDDGGAMVGVTDQGPGLPEEELQAIFQRFKQVGDVQRTSSKGFGLGLNIAKELAWLNLGELAVKSTLGEGATFFFNLPSGRADLALQRFMDRRASEGPGAGVSAVRVASLADGQDLEPVRDFVASISYATDLLLTAPDGRSLLLVGISSQPDQWCDRIRQGLVGCHDDAGFDPCELDFRFLGRWPAAGAYAEVVTELTFIDDAWRAAA